MDKITVPFLCGITSIESFLFLCLINLTKYNMYCWIFVVIVICILGFNLYHIAVRGIKYVNNYTKYQNDRIEKVVHTLSELSEYGMKMIERSDLEINEKLKIFIEKETEYIENTKKQLDTMTDLQKEMEKKLKEELIEYSALIYKNIEKLFSNAIDKLVSVENINIEKIKEFSIDYLKESFSTLSKEYQKMLEQTYHKNQKNIVDFENSVTKKMKEDIDNWHNEVTNIINIYCGNLDDVLKKYTDELVDKSAIAIGQVQKDNMSVITETNNKIIELSNIVDTTLKNNTENIKAIVLLHNKIKENLEKSLEEQKEQFEVFNEDFNENIDEMSKKIQKQFKDYQKQTIDISEEIEDITKEYHRLFDEILKSQTDMKSMTEKDIDLLKELIEK